MTNAKIHFGILLFIAGVILAILSLSELTSRTTAITTPLGQLNITPTTVAQPEINSYSLAVESLPSLPTFEQLATASAAISLIHPLWYTADNQGDITALPKAANSELLAVAKRNNVIIVPTLIVEFDEKEPYLLLTSSESRDAFYQSIIELTKEYDYAGFNLELRNLTTKQSEDVTALVTGLYELFSVEERLLFLTVPAQSGKPTDSQTAKSFDWISLAKRSDYLRITVTDPRKPIPLPSFDFLKDTIAYAKTTIPTEKIIICLSIRPWIIPTETGQASPYQSISNRIPSPTLEREETTKSLFGNVLNQNRTDTLWVEDRYSLLSKLQLLQTLSITRYSFDAYNGEESLLEEIL